MSKKVKTDLSLSLSLIQLPEMNMIARENVKNTRTEVIFFLIQNAGLLTGFSIILLITVFAGDINLG